MLAQFWGWVAARDLEAVPGWLASTTVSPWMSPESLEGTLTDGFPFLSGHCRRWATVADMRRLNMNATSSDEDDLTPNFGAGS